MAFVIPEAGAEKGELKTSVTSLTAKSPSATKVGELLICQIMLESSGKTVAMSGWTQIGTQGAASTSHLGAWFYKFATEEGEKSFSVTWGGATINVVQYLMFVVKKANASPVNASAKKEQATGNKAPAWAPITASQKPTLDLLMLVIDEAGETITTPGGYTKIGKEEYGVAYYKPSESTAEQSEVTTVSNKTDERTSMRVALLGEEEAAASGLAMVV